MKIHGFAAKEPKGPLSFVSFAAPDLQPHEILIQVTHSGICYTDLYMIDNAWGRSTYPLVPGHEIVGEVVAKGTFAHCEIGDRVGVGWTYSTCLECPFCLAGDTNLCSERITLYSRGRSGGFASHVVADSRFAFQIPKGIDSAHAAPLLCAGATVYSPIRNFGLQASHKLGVIGIGGLGHLALQYFCAIGCEVAALSSKKDKEQEAKQFGAHAFYSLDRPLPSSTFDFLLCTSDADLSWNELLASLRPNGILCMVSRPPGGMRLDPTYFVSSQKKICGNNNASRAVMNEMLAFSERCNIRPQIERMPLAQVNEALNRLRQGQVRYRIVLESQ